MHPYLIRARTTLRRLGLMDRQTFHAFTLRCRPLYFKYEAPFCMCIKNARVMTGRLLVCVQVTLFYSTVVDFLRGRGGDFENQVVHTVEKSLSGCRCCKYCL